MLQRTRLHLYLQPAVCLPGPAHGFLDRTGVIDVVILDQDHVIQPNAVVLAAPARHCQFIQRSQARGGLACIEDDRACPGHRLHKLIGQRGDPRHAPQEVERAPFGGQQTAGPPGYQRQNLLVLHPGPLVRLRLEFYPCIHRQVHHLSNIQPGYYPGLFGDDLPAHASFRRNDAVGG